MAPQRHSPGTRAATSGRVTNQGGEAVRDARQRILLVEDEGSVLFAIREYFTMRGHQVHGAADRETAEQLLAAQSFSWVVTDLHLTPGRSGEGLSVVRLARDSGADRIVLLTAHGAPEVVRAAEDSGADGVIAKPVRLADLERFLCDSEGRPA